MNTHNTTYADVSKTAPATTNTFSNKKSRFLKMFCVGLIIDFIASAILAGLFGSMFLEYCQNYGIVLGQSIDVSSLVNNPRAYPLILWGSAYLISLIFGFACGRMNEGKSQHLAWLIAGSTSVMAMVYQVDSYSIYSLIYFSLITFGAAAIGLMLGTRSLSRDRK
jgi:hypothetical protein